MAIPQLTRIWAILLGLLLAFNSVAAFASGVRGQPNSCIRLFSQTEKRGAPLPLLADDELDPVRWAKQFESRYQKSFAFDYIHNTPAPQFRIETGSSFSNPNDRPKFPQVDGVMISGEEHYPTETVFQNLGLDSRSPELMNVGVVLIVGEGRSGLGSRLSQLGYNVLETDVWYGADADQLVKLGAVKEAEFIRTHRAHLKAADVTALPFQTESVETILSHQVLNNLDEKKQDLGLQEMVRVLKPGGEIRIACLDQDGTAFQKLLHRFSLIPNLRFERRQIESSWNYQGRKLHAASTLLTVHKDSAK